MRVGVRPPLLKASRDIPSRRRIAKRYFRAGTGARPYENLMLVARMSLYCFGKIAISPADADALRAAASEALAPLGIDIRVDLRRDVDPEDANDLDTLGFVDDGLYFAVEAARGALDVTVS